MKYSLIALAFLIAGCTRSGPADTDTGGGNAPPISEPEPTPLCVDSGCGEKTALLTIEQAENIFFTDDGRLFVSGGTNVFEIKREGETYSATPIFDGTGNFGGMSQRGDVLYVNCFTDGNLYAARLTATPSLASIHDLGLGIPNGMSTGPDGELYIVNGPIPSSEFPDPKIVRLIFDPSDPMTVVEQTDWLTLTGNFPNGIARKDRTLYVTSSTPLPPTLGEVLSIAINDDGTAGEPQSLVTLDGIPDDLSLAGDSLLVSLYAGGSIAQVSLDGEVLAQTDPLSFDFPSQVRVGRPPLFSADEILVTEKGLIGDSLTTIGDSLTVFRRVN